MIGLPAALAGQITGERVSAPTAGFNPTFQRHVAAYRLCAGLLPEGRVLDHVLRSLSEQN